jgi:endoglucanase
MGYKLVKSIALAGTFILSGCMGPYHLNPDDWSTFQHHYVSPQGRITDTNNSDISHSEGQGVGMLFAVAYDDRAAFERIWSWTRQNLQIRDDPLFAWKWDPQADPPVPDHNNASDGDIMIAWALYRASLRWHKPAYQQMAEDILQHIRSTLLRPTPFGPVILPGTSGFDDDAGVTVNPSYWIYPAFAFFQQRQPQVSEWQALINSGIALLRAGRFGRWQLPPDWLRIEGDQVRIADNFKPRFGYDAIRIPLYLAWGGHSDAESVQNFAQFWDYFQGARFTPAWTDLSNDSIGSYDASPGFHAIIELVDKRTERQRGHPRNPAPNTREHYYSASLRLLSRLARSDTANR